MYKLEDRVIIAKHCARFYIRLKNLYFKIKENNYINYYNIINYFIPFIVGYYVSYLLLSK